MVTVGLVGIGHWGPNYLRILSDMEGVRMVVCADRDPNRLDFAKRLAPQARMTREAQDVLASPDVDAVIIAAPTTFHYEMGKTALGAGKHVLMEKPLAIRPEEAKALTDLAATEKRILMVGHTFLFNPGVTALHDFIHQGDLGHIHYLSLVRANLGPIREDVNALWDLAPHDISILLHLLGKMPLSVAAQGSCYVDPKREDVVFLTLRFPENVMAQIHVSWLEPVKVRRVTVIGDKKMAVFNDIDATEPIRVYDKGVTRSPKPYSDFNEFRVIIREGDVHIPKVPFAEPLKNECVEFISAVNGKTVPLSDGTFGLQVVQILDGATRSLRQGGIPIFFTR